LPTISFPQELISRQGEKSVATALRDEVKLFESRAAARIGQSAQLRERIMQSDEEIKGLLAQQSAKEGEIKLISEELVGVSALYIKNLVSISRIMTLKRDKARLEGERGQYMAEIARARGKISETEIQIIQLDRDFRSDVLNDLREAQGKIAELDERRTAAVDQLKRVDIRAPQSGVILDLSVHTVGGVIAPGETIMEIVPRADVLVVDARVLPQDIDQVVIGAKATIHIMAGDQRTIRDIEGVLTRVSADVTKDPQSDARPQQGTYLVRISLPPEQLRKLQDVHLVPGMTAEAFIQTYARTPIAYLLKPFREQIARTFKER
jgi:HlyD family secretion protein